MKKRILSAFLAALMFTAPVMSPVYAAEAETETVTSVEEKKAEEAESVETPEETTETGIEEEAPVSAPEETSQAEELSEQDEIGQDVGADAASPSEQYKTEEDISTDEAEVSDESISTDEAEVSDESVSPEIENNTPENGEEKQETSEENIENAVPGPEDATVAEKAETDTEEDKEISGTETETENVSEETAVQEEGQNTPEDKNAVEENVSETAEAQDTGTAQPEQTEQVKTEEQELVVLTEETVLSDSSVIEAKAAVAKPAMGEMKIEVIDFEGHGCGDAQMLSSKGKNLLIDTYDPDTWSVLRSWLLDRGYTNFEFYLSHYHDDHMGNIENIIKDGRFNVTKMYLPEFDYMTGDSSYMRNYISWCKRIFALAKQKNIPVQYITKGSTFKVGDVTAKVLYGTHYNASDHNTNYINNNSLLTRFSVKAADGEIRYLNGGDIERPAENRIMKANIDISANIFKLSHHGGDTSNQDAFLKKIGAAYYYYNYLEDGPNTYSPSSSWAHASARNAAKYGNVASVRYNGNITYTIHDGLIVQDMERNYKSATLYLYDKKDTKHLKGVVKQEYNKASKQFINSKSNPDYSHSTSKRTGTYANNEWVQGNEHDQYYYRNNNPVKGWQTIDGKKYYFNKSASKETGWLEIGNDSYYLGSDGAMRTGFVKVGSATHYFKSDGKQQKTGWATIDNKKYYFGAYNKLCFGITSVGGTKYVLHPETGELVTKKFVKIGSNMYYGESTGKMATGWRRINGRLYYFADKKYSAYNDSIAGKRLSGFKTINGHKFYFSDSRLSDPKGSAFASLLVGWGTINGKKYHSDKNGILDEGWTEIGDYTYYFESGRMVTGWKYVLGKLHYFYPDGHEQMQGTVVIGGKKCVFDKWGVCSKKG